jgi:tetratricopeptide (TPR) repeat protein
MPSSASRPRICLNMIVRDEAEVIARCLSAVRPLIDHWVIVDTGSSDDTPARIRAALAGIPGELHQRPWKDFGHNRSEAIALAEGCGDFLLFVDADDQLICRQGFAWPTLDRDAYEIEIQHDSLRYRRIALVRAALGWRFEGVVHEYPVCAAGAYSTGVLDGLQLRYGGDGARSRAGAAAKFARDAALLEAALATEPDNARYAFYLAQSYRDGGRLEDALSAYDRRAAMPGFDQETYCARLEAARLARRLDRPEAEVLARFLQAFETRPTRVEALGELATWCRQVGPRWAQAFAFAHRALQIPPSDDILFVEPAWHQWRLLDEYAVAAYWLGQTALSLQACEALLASPQLPPGERARVQRNHAFAVARLAERRRA